MWRDGAWRETRNPTIEEAKQIDGTAQTIGFGKFAERTYVEVWAYSPKYVGYLTNEGGSPRCGEIHRSDHAERGSGNSGS